MQMLYMGSGNGSVCVSDFFLSALGTPFSGALSSLELRAFAFSYCILFCFVWLFSLGSLIFSEGSKKWRGSGSRREKRW